MSAPVSDFGDRRGVSFQQIVDGFLRDDGLPFASVLSAERIMRVFAKHAGLFGFTGVYSTATVLWAFLNQVLSDGKAAACQAAVANISAHCLFLGKVAPTSDTGDYCRARAKLSEPAIRQLGHDVAEELEQQADESWLWKGRTPKLIDGFTFTMPDTEKNQAEYPQNPAQKPGLGFPKLRQGSALVFGFGSVMIWLFKSNLPNQVTRWHANQGFNSPMRSTMLSLVATGVASCFMIRGTIGD